MRTLSGVIAGVIAMIVIGGFAGGLWFKSQADKAAVDAAPQLEEQELTTQIKHLDHEIEHRGVQDTAALTAAIRSSERAKFWLAQAISITSHWGMETRYRNSLEISRLEKLRQALLSATEDEILAGGHALSGVR